MKYVVLGAGSWGTAIARMLAQKYDTVTLWARSPQLVAQLTEQKVNAAYLPGVVLPDSLSYTSDLAVAVTDADYIFIATPSHAVRDTIRQAQPFIKTDAVVTTAAKGLEASSLKRMSEVIDEELPNIRRRIAVLSGPNHAEEVGIEFPTTTVVAAASRQVAENVQDVLLLPYFRVYTNPDVAGVELGGALKNIIALGAGIADGLGFGDNSKAALMTRGLAEIARLGVAMGANPLTFSGLSGVGDLIVTCTSKHSRNRRAGILIAQGKSAVEVEQETRMVVEGIRATYAAYQLAARHQIEMPITEQMYQVLYNQKPPREAVLELMLRARTHEAEEIVISNNWKNW